MEDLIIYIMKYIEAKQEEIWKDSIFIMTYSEAKKEEILADNFNS